MRRPAHTRREICRPISRWAEGAIESLPTWLAYCHAKSWAVRAGLEALVSHAEAGPHEAGNLPADLALGRRGDRIASDVAGLLPREILGGTGWPRSTGKPCGGRPTRGGKSAV